MQEDAATATKPLQSGRWVGDSARLQTHTNAISAERIISDADMGCACAALRRASRCVTRLYDLVLAPCGVKCTQFTSLHAIDEAGEIAQYHFARNYGVAVETLSRRLGALRRKGLVRVRTGTYHGEQIYSLTDEGKKVLNDARPYWDRAQERLRTVLGEADWNALFSITDGVARAALEAEKLRLHNLPGCGEKWDEKQTEVSKSAAEKVFNRLFAHADSTEIGDMIAGFFGSYIKREDVTGQEASDCLAKILAQANMQTSKSETTAFGQAAKMTKAAKDQIAKA
jgi:DNA-binding MarR family transcriptional regulator